MKDSVRIYYNNQCIFFTERPLELTQKEGLRNAWVFHKGERAKFLDFANSPFENLVYRQYPEAGLKKFAQEFDLIHAAGGVVWNDENELLMIFRLGKWDLPKGKQDDGETIESCALREVKEETGLSQLSIKHYLKPTYHIYQWNDTWVLKKTDWFEMHASKAELMPQAEEGIQQAVWVPKDAVPEKLMNTYPNIHYLLDTI